MRLQFVLFSTYYIRKMFGKGVKTITNKNDQILEDLICTNLMQRGVGNVNPMKMTKCIMELERIYGIRHGGDRGNKYGIAKAHNAPLVNQEELADKLGISDDQLKRYKQLIKLVPDIQDLVAHKKVKPTVAYNIISKLTEEEQQELFNRLGETGLKGKPSHEVERQIELYRKEKDNAETKIAEREIELENVRKERLFDNRKFTRWISGK